MIVPLPSARVLEALAVLCLGLSVFAAAAGAQLDAHGPVRVLLDRYLAFLDRKLRAVFSRVPAGRVALAQGVIGVFSGGLLLAAGIPYWYLALLVAAVAPGLHLERTRRQRVSEIERQLDAFMLALANALKSIPGVTPAFQSVAETSPLPIRQELELCNREMRVGSTLDEALTHMASRVGSSRLDSAITAIVLGRQIGGNLPRVLETTAGSVREMSRLEGVLRTKTAEGKMQLYVIGAAPLFLIAALAFLSPGYFNPLAESSLGYLVGISAGGSWLFALYLARKVLSVSL